MASDRPIYRLFRNGIIASGMAMVFSTQLLCPSASYAADPVTELSPAAVQVSKIAAQNGDQNFLLLDKTNGRIIVFEHGTPTFSGAALTGESLTDIIPQDAYSKSFSETRGLKYKVTPAGRFTVSPGFDPAYGETLDVNEVHGRDWDISIHRVWLGAPAEHRDVRLRTATGQDKHITYGCIDVDQDTIHQLLRHVSRGSRIAIYIVPVDEHLVATLFQPHNYAQDAATPGVRPTVRLVSGTATR